MMLQRQMEVTFNYRYIVMHTCMYTAFCRLDIHDLVSVSVMLLYCTYGIQDF